MQQFKFCLNDFFYVKLEKLFKLKGARA